MGEVTISTISGAFSLPSFDTSLHFHPCTPSCRRGGHIFGSNAGEHRYTVTGQAWKPRQTPTSWHFGRDSPYNHHHLKVQPTRCYSIWRIYLVGGFSPPIWKHMRKSKWRHLPQGSGWKRKKCLKPPPSQVQKTKIQKVLYLLMFMFCLYIPGFLPMSSTKNNNVSSLLYMYCQLQVSNVQNPYDIPLY